MKIQRFARKPRLRRPVLQWERGKHFIELPIAGHTDVVNRGRIEVVEFFWYGCTHCYSLEPHLQQWIVAKPPDADLVRVPVAWNRPDRVALAKLHYALNVMNRPDLHRTVFDRIYVDREMPFVPNNESQTLKNMLAFAQEHQMDPDRFRDIYLSEAGTAYVKWANELAVASQVSGVPSIVVGGIFLSDVARAGSEARLMELVNFLVARARGSQRRSLVKH